MEKLFWGVVKSSDEEIMTPFFSLLGRLLQHPLPFSDIEDVEEVDDVEGSSGACSRVTKMRTRRPFAFPAAIHDLSSVISGVIQAKSWILRITHTKSTARVPACAEVKVSWRAGSTEVTPVPPATARILEDVVLSVGVPP